MAASENVELIALLEVRQVVESYFGAVDRREWTELHRCFAEDAEMYFGWDPEKGVASEMVVGADAIVSAIRQVEVFPTSIHALAHTRIDVVGELARVDTTATAVLEDLRTPDEPILRVRGLRYRDEMARSPSGWCIASRRHTPLWELDAPSVPLMPIPATVE